MASYRKQLLGDFVRENFFLYDKSNLIEESFITETNELISVYGSISYFGKKLDEIVEIVSINNPLEFNVKKNTVRSSLNFHLAKVNRTNITLIDKKIKNQ